MNWYNILIFGVIPVFIVVIIFLFKRKLLWITPFMSTALSFITYNIALAPTSIIDIFSNNEWRGFFLLAMLMHFGITVVLTMIAYFIAHLIKRKKQ